MTLTALRQIDNGGLWMHDACRRPRLGLTRTANRPSASPTHPALAQPVLASVKAGKMHADRDGAQYRMRADARCGELRVTRDGQGA